MISVTLIKRTDSKKQHTRSDALIPMREDYLSVQSEIRFQSIPSPVCPQSAALTRSINPDRGVIDIEF